MFSAKFYKLRKESKLTQKELAAVFGVTDVTISNFERGTRSPDQEMLLKISNYFDVSTDYLLKEGEIPRGSYDAGLVVGQIIDERIVEAYASSPVPWSEPEILSLVAFIEGQKALREKKQAILEIQA